jgi:hypothetical protein
MQRDSSLKNQEENLKLKAQSAAIVILTRI